MPCMAVLSGDISKGPCFFVTTQSGIQIQSHIYQNSVYIAASLTWQGHFSLGMTKSRSTTLLLKMCCQTVQFDTSDGCITISDGRI